MCEQVCWGEQPRRRKRGQLADAGKRIVINEAVCEGCGDCGRQSNCVSIVPLETEFGRKRQVDQTTCNQDATSVEGFCPSFGTTDGGILRRFRTHAAQLPAVRTPPQDFARSPNPPFGG